MSEFDYFPRRHDGDRLDVSTLLRQGLQQADDRPVLVFDGQPWSAPQLRSEVARCQSWLAGQGVAAGDRVAVMLGNSPAHIVLIYALILCGIEWVPINTRLKSAGLRYVLEHSRPQLAIADAQFCALFEGSETDTPMPVRVVRPMAVQQAGRDGAPAALQQAEVAPSATLCIIYTSGTTGAPKGVLFSHRMMRIATEGALHVTGAAAGDRLFLWEPLCHVGGAQMLLSPFMAGVQLHIVPSFSASRFWDQVTRAQATHLHYLGGVIDILLQLPRSSVPPAHTLKVVWGAGLSVKTWKEVEDAFGVQVRECYGMTECSSFTTFNAEGRPGSIGRALPWFEVDLVDASGEPVPVGEHGELVVTSKVEGAFLSGYLDNPAATADALRDGRFHTGDFAWRDADGFLYFVGRRTDSMRVRGENVSAWEVERVFAQHPALARSAVIGVASEIGEQEIVIYLCPKDGAPPADPHAVAAELAEWAARQLPSYQVPRYYKWIDRFELTPSERVRKHLLPRALTGAWDRVARAEVAG